MCCKLGWEFANICLKSGIYVWEFVVVAVTVAVADRFVTVSNTCTLCESTENTGVFQHAVILRNRHFHLHFLQ